MHEVWQPLLANLAVIAVFISFWTTIQNWLQEKAARHVNFFFGMLCGVTGVAVMAMPLEVARGVFFDLRTVPIILGGFFGGPVGGLLSGAITCVYRISGGGGGMESGLIGIGMATAIGIFLYWQRHRAPLTFADIIDLAFAGAGTSLLAVLALPASLHSQIFEYAALPSIMLILTAIILTGSAIMHEKRRREIARTNEIYGAIMDALPDSLNAKDSRGRFLVANPATAALMGAADSAGLIGRTDGDFYDAETATQFREDEDRVICGGQPRTLEQKFVRRDGRTAWLSTLKVPFPSPDGQDVGIITHNRDITDRKRLELELKETRDRLSDALTHMADGLVMFSGDGRLVYSSERFRKMFSIPDTVMLTGTPLKTILQQATEGFKIVMSDGETAADWVEEELRKVSRLESTVFQLSDGRWFQNRHASVRDGAWLTVFTDITDRKRSEQELIELNAKLEVIARTDGLTGLTNRNAFDDRFYAEFARSHRHGNKLGLMMADVDRFKAYNDIYGHPEGDVCLKAVADCLKRATRRAPDVAARYGGEEFVAILPDTDEAGMRTIAERFRQSVRDLGRTHVGSEKGVVTVSVGVAVMTPDTAVRGPADLLKIVDQALYRAKGAGRDCTRMADMPRRPASDSAEQWASGIIAAYRT